jgi:hypothetical protein
MSPRVDTFEERDQAALRSDIGRLTVAHIERNANGGYGSPSGYQHHSRVIRQLTAKLGSAS